MTGSEWLLWGSLKLPSISSASASAPASAAAAPAVARAAVTHLYLEVFEHEGKKNPPLTIDFLFESNSGIRTNFFSSHFCFGARRAARNHALFGGSAAAGQRVTRSFR